MALTTSTKSSSTRPKLLDQVRAMVHVKHYSYRTEQAHVHRIKQFILFNNKINSPETGEKEIKQFILHNSPRSARKTRRRKKYLKIKLFG